ncbi:hypothetical protein Q9252_12010 [Marinobacter salarius]|uniref:hypothetical protein n=1 Tax=Marinobacter salarius TaxID=1420917 RepID=UPI00273C6B1B|nr:hypothetical protein [Marinobacter salarius]MDP4532869.1 hypothetical protein [Marinobacter salarius]
MQDMVFDAGILTTAVLGVLGYLWKLGLRRKESARTLLFHLLEIRHELLIERPKLDAVVEEFQSEFREILGDRPNLKSLMIDQVPREHIAAVLATLMDGLVRADAKLLDSYESALFDYSRINPLLTYRVRGMKLLPKLSDNLSNIASTMAGAIPNGEETELVTSLGKKELESSRQKTLGELVADLEKIIRRVSWSAGLSFWIHSWFLGSKCRKQESKNENVDMDLQALMERFFRSVMLAGNPPGDLKKQVENATLEEILDLFEASYEEAVD